MLVQGYKTWWRQWSTWLCGAGFSVVLFTPELHMLLLNAWEQMPVDVKQTIPETWIRYFGLMLGLISIPAKYIRQKKLYDEVKNSR